jgi:hypothetical protein
MNSDVKRLLMADPLRATDLRAATVRERVPILVAFFVVVMVLMTGCQSPKTYGREDTNFIPPDGPKVWAVAPTINLSGQRGIDPLIQSDLLFQQLQEVRGITVIPVNRVVEVLVALRIRDLQSPEQARLICEQLGADALVVPSITIYSPYNPPKMGGSIQVFLRNPEQLATMIDPRELARQSTPDEIESLPTQTDFLQAADMFDAANGSVRDAVALYAQGRTELEGPLGEREYFLNMQRYSRFVWHELIDKLLRDLPER